jgi:hypothetical protein
MSENLLMLLFKIFVYVQRLNLKINAIYQGSETFYEQNAELLDSHTFNTSELSKYSPQIKHFYPSLNPGH